MITDSLIPRTVEDVTDEVLIRRAAGEVVRDEEIVLRYAWLRPDLDRALKHLSMIHNAACRATQLEPMTASPNASRSPIQNSRVVQPLPSVIGYSVTELLEIGGQGAVYLATDDLTGQRTAIKILMVSFRHTEEEVRRFEREADVLSRVDHPHIVRILSRGRTVEGFLYVATEYVDGVSFDRFLEQCRIDPGGLEKFVELMMGVCEAIGAIHSLGIVHRDLKPSNIRVDLRGTPKVLDFGLAGWDREQCTTATTTDLTMLGQLVGSVPYFSPEVIRDGSADVSTTNDVYALGLLLYRGITGSAPYETIGPLPQIFKNILHARPKPISRQRMANTSWRLSSQSAGLNAILQTTLAKNPHDRYMDAAEVAAELRAWRSGDGTLAQRRLRRHRRYLGLWLAILAISLVSALSATAWYLQPVAPTVVQLPRFANSAGIKFVMVPAGGFVMGSPAAEAGHQDNERGHWTVILRSYWLSPTEVSVGQYRQIMKLPALTSQVSLLPVSDITPEEAEEFCARLSKLDGRHYRLPLESEWEYACRAGSPSAYGGTGRLTDMGWFAGNSGSQLHPRGAKFPNHWGFVDMHGNVAEMCSANEGHADRDVDTTLQSTAVRGGDFSSSGTDCRSASRRLILRGYHNARIGFRLACDPE